MEYKHKVSIILTSYNKPNFLKRAIGSVLSQTFKDFQLIIADDNSPDRGVWQTIESFKDSRIISFNSHISDEERLQTARYATQINTAVRQYSDSQYICYLADDDIYYQEMLERMVSFADSTGHDVTFCAQDLLNVYGEISGIRWYASPLTCGYNILDHNQVMTTRRIFDQLNGWDDDPSYWSGADAYFFRKIEKSNTMFYPIDYDRPLQGKTYRINSVQWNVFNNIPPTETSDITMEIS